MSSFIDDLEKCKIQWYGINNFIQMKKNNKTLIIIVSVLNIINNINIKKKILL